MPVRITQTRTTETTWESRTGLLCRHQSTSIYCDAGQRTDRLYTNYRSPRRPLGPSAEATRATGEFMPHTLSLLERGRHSPREPAAQQQ